MFELIQFLVVSQNFHQRQSIQIVSNIYSLLFKKAFLAVDQSQHGIICPIMLFLLLLLILSRVDLINFGQIKVRISIGGAT
jgi:hypothetical protein